MSRLLVIYNTCGISGKENTNNYIHSLNTILNQDFIEYDVVVSDCLSSENVRQKLISNLNSKVYFNFIDSKLPVNITFNSTVQTAITNNGEYDAYLYIDSGVDFSGDSLVLKKLYDLCSNECSMVVGRVKTDTGFHAWLGWGTDEHDYVGHRNIIEKIGHFEIPIGRAVNLHVQLFSHDILAAYGNLVPDIFAGQCTESVFSFLAAAIQTKWLIHKDIELDHRTGLDVPSVGFSPVAWRSSGLPTWDHLIGVEESILDIIGRGKKYGMGYEELSGIVNHNPSKFDSRGFALDPNLKYYIKTNLFLQPHQLDYDTIVSKWIMK